MATAKQNETFADTLATVLHQDAEHTVYRLGGADGEVVQTVYSVFPGIEIVYHDVHATACVMQRTRAPGCLEIHHCREGRIAYPYGDACFSFRRAIWRSCGARRQRPRRASRPSTTTASRCRSTGTRTGLPVVLSRGR